MTPEAADWVYQHVLTPAYRDGMGCGEKGPVMVRICPCEWDTCSNCLWGRHAECHERALPGIEAPATRIVDRSGAVVVEHRTGRLAAVWPSGTPCVWRCACPCVRPVGAQLGLFDLAGGAR